MSRPSPSIAEAISRAVRAKVDAVDAAIGLTPSLVKQSLEFSVEPGHRLPTGEKLFRVRVDREVVPVEGRHGVDEIHITVWALTVEGCNKAAWQVMPPGLAARLTARLPDWATS